MDSTLRELSPEQLATVYLDESESKERRKAAWAALYAVGTEWLAVIARRAGDVGLSHVFWLYLEGSLPNWDKRSSLRDFVAAHEKNILRRYRDRGTLGLAMLGTRGSSARSKIDFDRPIDSLFDVKLRDLPPSAREAVTTARKALTTPSDEDAITLRHLLGDVLADLREKDNNLADIFVEVRLRERTQAEVARERGISEATVSRRLCEATDALRRAVQKSS